MKVLEFIRKYLDKNKDYNIINDHEINLITDDSRKVIDGSIFVVIKGINENGENYLLEAIKKGCKSIIINKLNDHILKIINKEEINILEIDNVSEWYLDYLLKVNKKILDKIKIIGVTGTNGKTTSTYLVYLILRKYYSTMLVGTNGIYVYEKNKEIHYNTSNTTPKLNIILEILNNHPKIKFMILEVSSDSIETKRLGNLKFDIIGFTNIGHDHVNTHKTYLNYINKKVSLFKQFKNNGLKHAIINADDKYNDLFIKTLRKDINLHTYGLNKGKLRGELLTINKNYMMVNVYDKDHEMTLGTNLLGRFNIYNILLVIKICYLLNISFNKIIDHFSRNIDILGRYKKISKKDFDIYIDYAHNPEAIKEFLCLINTLYNNRIITIVGAGGLRDKEKRSKMGYYSSLYSDILILTEDCSRTEDVKMIVEDLTKEIKNENYFIEYDRVSAIKKAIFMAEKDDVIVILGMGNDTYGDFNELTDELVVNKFVN